MTRREDPETVSLDVATIGVTRDSEHTDKGDAPSFVDYVTHRSTALLRFTTLLTGDEHRAEDLVQDALAKAYLRWDQISQLDQPDLYLRRMLINASRSWWRRKVNRELPVEATVDRPSGYDLDGQVAERDALWRLITGLPRRQRAVVILRYYEDLDDASIAQILECSTNTVRSHAMRALNVLRLRYPASWSGAEVAS